MEHVEPYLMIKSNAIIDESVFNLDYTELICNVNNSLNQTYGSEMLFTLPAGNNWYLPSKSYLLFEGRIQ